MADPIRVNKRAQLKTTTQRQAMRPTGRRKAKAKKPTYKKPTR